MPRAVAVMERAAPVMLVFSLPLRATPLGFFFLFFFCFDFLAEFFLFGTFGFTAFVLVDFFDRD